jgi:DNA repair protein SbcC/Rad50
MMVDGGRILAGPHSLEGRSPVRITRVSLDNIKSYRRANIPLAGGTVAIRGHNGAGKSTLVEAIGFALFDSIKYNQAQFVREGEKSGTVTVSFISALDEREYQVVRRCGANPTWYVYDPQLRLRVVEQSADVTDFLRKHLRIESEITLHALFDDALGVPQGTFTADFLLTPTNRKKKFDALLQVEDYASAAARLNDTRAYLQEEQHAAQRRIDELERETGQLDALRERLANAHQRERELAAELERLQREASEVEARRDALQRRQAELERLESAARVAAAESAAAEQRERAASDLWEEARAAADICAAARPGYDAHRGAQARQAELAARARERDALQHQRAQAAQALEGAERDLAHGQHRLAGAREAGRRILELQPAIARQSALEQQCGTLRHDLLRLEELRRAREKAERERAAIAQGIAAAEREIARLEGLLPLAAQLEARREKVTGLQDLRARRTEKETRLVAVRAERGKAAVSRQRAGQSEAKAAEKVRKIRETETYARQLPALEERYATLEAEIHKLEARQEHHRLSREQSDAGACPFLREPCLNIRQRGENSLTVYFDRLIAQDERALAPLREERAGLLDQLAYARKVRPYWEQLDQFEEQHRAAEQQRGELDAREQELAAEQAELEDFVARAPGEAALRDAQSQFKASDDADKACRELGPRRAEHARLCQQRDALDADLAANAEQAAALAESPTQLTAAEAELAALDDPRGVVKGLGELANEQQRIEVEVAAAEARVAKLRDSLTALDRALAPFVGLDDNLRAIQGELDATRDDHTRYLQREQTAAQLQPRAKALEEARGAAKAAAAAHAKARATHERARAGFDPGTLAQAVARADALAGERGRATEELRHTQETSTALSAEIARAEALLADLSAARDELATLVELHAMLQQLRETIKEAGPYVMKARLRQISAQANRIFGEVMGDRSAELLWQNDYEIVLRRDGVERSFAQLSGGEQMSAALAVRLALLRHLTRLDLAFFDEPTQNMDGERRGNLAEQIRRVRGFDQLLVISHDDTFEQGLDSVVHLEKRNGETVVIDEGALVPA